MASGLYGRPFLGLVLLALVYQLQQKEINDKFYHQNLENKEIISWFCRNWKFQPSFRDNGLNRRVRWVKLRLKVRFQVKLDRYSSLASGSSAGALRSASKTLWKITFFFLTRTNKK